MLPEVGGQRGGGLRLAVLLAILATTLVSPGRGNCQEVPAVLEASILMKVLSYDNNLNSRSGDKLVLGLVYVEGEPRGESCRRRMTPIFTVEMASTTVRGLSIHSVEVPLSPKRSVAADIDESDANALYLCPGLDDYLRSLLSHARAKRLLTLTGVEDYVRNGAAVGVGLRETKPKIIVNLESAKAAGADLDPRLLVMAEVIQK